MPVVVAVCVLTPILIILSRIQIYIEYKRHNENDRLIVKLKYFKIKLYEFDVSMIDISRGEKGYGFRVMANKLKNNPQDEGHGFIHFDTLIKIYKDIKNYYRLYTQTLKDIRRSLARTSIIEIIDMKVELGVFDHALTGISSGLAYSILWNIFSYIANNIKTKKHEILVTPRFDTNIFRFHFFCIYTIRIGNIIYVVARLIILYIVHRIINSRKIKKTNINLNIN